MVVATSHMSFIPRKYSPTDDRINNNTPSHKNHYRRTNLTRPNHQHFPIVSIFHINKSCLWLHADSTRISSHERSTKNN